MHVEFLTHLEMRNLTAVYIFISSQHDLFGFIGRKSMTLRKKLEEWQKCNKLLHGDIHVAVRSVAMWNQVNLEIM